MKSPFPGMDPYLERRWQNVHASLIVFARGQLNAQLGGGFVADIEERLVVEQFFSPRRPIRPDVFVVDVDRPDSFDAGGGTAVAVAPPPAAVAKPKRYHRTLDPLPQRYLQIVDPEGGEVVTVIEFVSPTNKTPGDGRDQYVRKQREALEAGINLVEIDLTRAGRRELAMTPEEESTYLALVTRGFDDPMFEAYPLSLREPLPAIAIPLRGDAADVPLALQPLVDQAYAEGLMDRRLDYSQPLNPPLPPDEAAWAADLLAPLLNA